VITGAVLFFGFTSAAIESVNILEDTPFTESDYFKIVEALWGGLQWESRYKEFAEDCRIAAGELLDDFYYLKVNATSTELKTDVVFNTTAILSGSYAKTMYTCYNLERDIQAEFKLNDLTFIDDNDKYTSFLFNLLANSIDIRTYSYDLIDFSE
jgi:hypothetical protein